MEKKEKMEQGTPDRGFACGGMNRGMIINVVLFLGLVVLYGLYFMGNPVAGERDAEEIPEVERKIDEATHAIAYVNNEILMEQYDMAIQMREDFENEQRELEADLERRQRTFQNDVERFQQQVQAGTVDMEEAQMMEQELMQRQQDLMQLNETYMDRLARKEMELNEELLEKISDFLERYNQDKEYDFILGYSRGGGILFADQAYDVTADVLQQLNDEYAQTQ
ncbi:MAG: OmpH family outer membrane protein [Bacteroidales bacterium]